jgi:hypothetical protein
MASVLSFQVNESVHAFVQGTSDDETLSLKAECAKSLSASHLIPSAFHAVDKMPVTKNGKVDKERLKEMAAKAEKNKSMGFIDLGELWMAYSGAEPSTASNFLIDGGDSFKAVHLAGDLAERMGRQGLN